MARGIAWVAALLIAAVVLWPRHGGAPPAVAPGAAGPAAAVSRPVAEAPAPAPGARDVGFRSRERLEEHFAKHGREFGAVSLEQYLALAQALRDRPAGGAVLEGTRADGVITRFDRASGAFLAFDADGTIRTFFKPNQGERYYQRQLERGAP